MCDSGFTPACQNAARLLYRCPPADRLNSLVERCRILMAMYAAVRLELELGEPAVTNDAGSPEQIRASAR